MGKDSTPNDGGWRTTDFLNVVYNKRTMSSLSTANLMKAATKGLGIVFFGVVVNTVGYYTIRRQPLPARSIRGAIGPFVAGTAGIIGTEYVEEMWMKKRS